MPRHLNQYKAQIWGSNCSNEETRSTGNSLQLNMSRTVYKRGTQRSSWLRHCATSRKVVGSIPESVTGFFHWHNSSGRTMTLGLTQPLTEMSTRNNSWGKGGRCLGRTNFPPSLSLNPWASTSWKPQGLSRPVMEFLYPHCTQTVSFWVCIFLRKHYVVMYVPRHIQVC
jgi:hypothetical protein